MRGISAVASGQAFSACAVLVVTGGLALYQMTSLVLGPASSRQLHLSLAIPTVNAGELSEAVSPSVNHVLGMVAGEAPAPSVSAARRALGQPAEPRAIAAAAPAPPVATLSALPVAAEPATRHAHGYLQPPKRHGTD
jgi:hypothetical protein